jgi:hypothetical protein
MMDVLVDAHGASDVTVKRHAAGSDAARRLLKIRAGTWPDTGSSGYPSEASPRTADANEGPDRDFNDVRGGATWQNEVVAVTFRIPHDGDPTTFTQIVTLHGRATDPDGWVDTQEHPNDPYTPHFHNPYSGTSGTDSLDAPRAGAPNEGPGDSFEHESFFAEWNAQSAQTNPRASHDPLKISWQCGASANNQQVPAVAPYESLGHAQGHRKSTGQRTQGNDVFFDDERASCSTVPDVTGFKPACLVHSYDQAPAKFWGAHALQDGPTITLTVDGPDRKWPTDSAADVTHTCTMTATDPYGNTDTLDVVITVQAEQNVAPVAAWRTGGVTTYTVPHDHSPETHHVQVLLDGDYSDSDNLDRNIGPLGNTATETTKMGIQEQLNWQFAEDYESTDGYDGIFVGNAPAKKYVGTGYCADGSYSSKKEYASVPELRYCQDACSDWPECHTLWYNAATSACNLYSNCQNNDASMITGDDGERYTKEVKLGTSWAMFRGRPRSYQPYSHESREWNEHDNSLNSLHSNYAWKDHMHGHGNDTVTFLWTCPTADGEFFEETLGSCAAGADAAAAFEVSDRSGYCEKTDITGDVHDYCQDLCMRTSGCNGFEIRNVEYRGICYESDCDANTCHMMMGSSTATPTCPTDWTAVAGVGSYSGACNGHNCMHGNGRKASRCYTRKPGQQLKELQPVVSLPGPEWTLAGTGAWAEPGGQTGDTAGSGGQWAAQSVTHDCTLRVTDSYGATTTHTETITVNREPNTLPVASAGDAAVHTTGNAATQSYTVPHDFYPTDETNHVLVTLYGGNTADADGDQLKHTWTCNDGTGDTAWATVELPFPVQLGGINTGFREHWQGGLQTGGGDPNYVESTASIQMSDGWGADLGHSGDGDLFEGTHSHQTNEITVMLGPGTHTCTLTTTDTYNEASTSQVVVTVAAEPNNNPNAQ